MADDDTITFSLEPMTDGYPVLVNQAFRDALVKAVAGGAETQTYFDAVNATADFWKLMATKAITFSPGHDPQGREVLMASSGNVELRVAGVYAGDGKPAEHPPFGILTIDTHNTTTNVVAGMAVLARFATMPVYLPIAADLFAKLIVPLYENVKAFLGISSSKLAAEAAVEVPEIDGLAVAEEVIDEQDQVIIEVEELAEEGIDYMAIQWGAMGLNVAGLAALSAIPMIIEFLGHEMTHSLIVQNMSGVDFTFQVDQIWGRPSYKPGVDKLPRTATATDPLYPDTTRQYSYSANYHFVNTTNLGPIGYVLTLKPGDGSPAAYVLVSVPWAGDNTIWVGQWDGSAQALWNRHSNPNGELKTTASFGSYKVTLSLNALAGKNEGAYFYCSMALIE